MTPNETLSIVNALKRERSDDYYENIATIEWPLGPHGESFGISGSVILAAVVKHGSNTPAAKEFVRFLVGEGWLMHYLDFSGERLLPPISALSDQPFWAGSPSDPHRRPRRCRSCPRPRGATTYAVYGGRGANSGAEAIHRVARLRTSAPSRAVGTRRSARIKPDGIARRHANVTRLGPGSARRPVSPGVAESGLGGPGCARPFAARERTCLAGVACP